MRMPPPKTQDANDLIQLDPKWATDLGLGANPTAMFGAPISFTAHLDGLTPGQQNIQLATSALANGFRTPYVIDEIRMQAYMGSLTSGAEIVQSSYATRFQFRTGAYAFSKVAVPMILHQPAYNTTVAPLLSGFDGALFRQGDEARWLLAKPLWMAPGDQIQAAISRDVTAASLNNVPFSVDVTYVGRTLKPGTPGPKIRYVPWIAHYIHDFDNVYSETTTEFRNPFMYPLTIHRLVGRPLSKAANGAFPTARTHMLPQSAGLGQYANIYMEDSLGYKITRDYMPAGAIFDTERCVWTFSRPIGAREQLDMKFRTLGTEVVPSVLFGIAMQGYREETA